MTKAWKVGGVEGKQLRQHLMLIFLPSPSLTAGKGAEFQVAAVSVVISVVTDATQSLRRSERLEVAIKIA